MKTRTDNSFMPGIERVQSGTESKTCPSDLSEEGRCVFYYDTDKNGNLSYRGVTIKGFVHTHPYIDINNSNPANPLYVSKEDIVNAASLGMDEINILFLDGSYYSQGVSGNSIYSPNFKFNVYKDF